MNVNCVCRSTIQRVSRCAIPRYIIVSLSHICTVTISQSTQKSLFVIFIIYLVVHNVVRVVNVPIQVNLEVNLRNCLSNKYLKAIELPVKEFV